jgi:hypothetical protein
MNVLELGNVAFRNETAKIEGVVTHFQQGIQVPDFIGRRYEVIQALHGIARAFNNVQIVHHNLKPI